MQAPLHSHQPTRRDTHMDFYAVGVCSLCLLHCIALPFAATLLPIIGLVAEDELVHKLLVVAAVPVTLWLIYKSITTEKYYVFVLFGLVGLSFLLVAAFVESLSLYEVTFTLIGSLLLAFAHIYRWTRYRQAIQ